MMLRLRRILKASLKIFYHTTHFFEGRLLPEVVYPSHSRFETLTMVKRQGEYWYIKNAQLREKLKTRGNGIRK